MLDAVDRKIVTLSHQIATFLVVAIGIACVDETKAHEKVSFDLTQKATCQLANTTLKANGELKVGTGDQARKTPIHVLGTLRYWNLPRGNSADEALLTARVYETAEAEISVGGRSDKSQLDAARRLMVVRRQSNQLTYYSPQGPLTRGDLELVAAQCDPCVARQLLPEESVEVNQTWKPAENVLADLFGLQHVTKSTIECKLLSATDHLAEIQIAGVAEGITLGAKSTLKLDGTITFDRKRREISRIAVTVNEKRDVGLFAPGFRMEAHIDTTLSPAKAPKELSNEVVSKLAAEPGPSDTAIQFASPNMGVAFLHDRHWRVTLHRRDLLVLRMVRDGSFVAQCNMTPATEAGDDPKADAARFQVHVEQAVGKIDGQIDEVSTATREDGVQILRIAATGKANDVPITWVYYMLAEPSGKRLALVFTYATAQQENFETADHDLIGSVKVIDASRSAQRDTAGAESR